MNRPNDNDNPVAQAYISYQGKLLRYIQSRINNYCDAENIAQDVWVKILTNGKELQCETIGSYLYTIARNLVNDYLRRLYNIALSHDDYLTEVNGDFTDNSLESELAARELARMEEKKVECLPPMRRIIYIMSRYDEIPVDDISRKLDLSKRTVENHLRLGRKDVRTYLADIA